MKYLHFLFVSLPLSLTKIVVALLGIIVVPIGLLFAKEEKTDLKEQYPGWKYKRLPKVLLPWDNADYGTMGNHTYALKAYNPLFHKKPGSYLSQIYWLAIRNPANGLNRISLFQCDPKQTKKVKYKGKQKIDNGIKGYQFVWTEDKKANRMYTGLYVMWPYAKWKKKQLWLELRIGYKLLPFAKDRTRLYGMTFIINPLKGL